MPDGSWMEPGEGRPDQPYLLEESGYVLSRVTHAGGIVPAVGRRLRLSVIVADVGEERDPFRCEHRRDALHKLAEEIRAAMRNDRLSDNEIECRTEARAIKIIVVSEARALE